MSTTAINTAIQSLSKELTVSMQRLGRSFLTSYSLHTHVTTWTLIQHPGPKYFRFRKFKKDLEDPELVDQIPLKKTQKVPNRALDISPGVPHHKMQMPWRNFTGKTGFLTGERLWEIVSRLDCWQLITGCDSRGLCKVKSNIQHGMTCKILQTGSPMQ